MSIHIDVQIADEITPLLRQLQAKLSGSQMTSAMRSIGIGIAALTKRAFDDPSLRPSAWPAKKDGSTATLRRKGMLWRSPRVTSAAANQVTVGSDRPYAGIHQLGYSGQVQVPSHTRRGNVPVRAHTRSLTMLARPFFPVAPDGTPTAHAQQTIREVLAAHLRLRS